jgi:adenine-specific DNA-methyltransferase
MNLKKTYNQASFLEYIKNDFLPSFSKDVRAVDIDDKYKTIREATFLGDCEELELSVFELKVDGSAEKKISQARDGFRIMKEYQVYRALMAYYSDDDLNWRFSLMQMTPDINEKGKVITNISNPRRYSFYLGPDAKTKTPERYLIKEGKAVDFDDLLKRFSVEVVNKDFYKDIARFFNRLVGGDVKLESKAEHFEAEMNLPSVDKSDKKTYQEFAVRLIGRIIFCWFLKQKKSDKKISLLPDEFLSVSAVNKNYDYYHNVLEKIFFEVLNKPINQRNPELTNGYSKIPYLNGGLFDPQGEDFYDNRPNWALKIPDKWFLDLYEVLDTYNFTIDENTILDVDLSIDPEMLGRIFENLLAEINPETGQSARKSTGSYYTPRQIVDYMVDQSLIQYLLNKSRISEDKIRALVSIDESDDAQFPLTNDDRQKIVSALDEVKIIDPACGSGAFPMGILQKIVFMLGKIDPDGQLWFEKKTESLDLLLKEEFKKKFENENFDYIRKTGVIRDSIYGVDIQPIAVDVTKLRCFLTLVVDEDIFDDADNRGIKPLPNLEFKFVAANTLINLPGTVSRGGQTGLFEDEAEIKQLVKLRDQYFVSNGQNKDLIKYKFKDVQKEMFKKQIKVGGEGKMTMALADWDPFSNKASSWFDPKWMFGVNKFDIVIANPPYINISKIDKDLVEKYKSEYKAAQYGRFDLYVVFIEIALNLLSEKGVQSFIIPDKLCYQKYAINIRKIIVDSCDIKQIINLKGIKIFESAVVDNIVYVLQKGNSKDNAVNIVNVKKGQRLEECLTNNPSIIMQAMFKQFNECMFRLSIKDDDLKILDKIKNKSLLLRQICYVSFGLQPGNLDKFVFNLKENQEKASIDKAHQKKFLRGRNINRYYITYSDDIIFYLPKELHRPAFPELFENNKIIISEISRDIRCAFDSEHYYSNEKTVLVVPWKILQIVSQDVLSGRGIHLVGDNIVNSEKFSLLFILTILNSKTTNYYFQKLISDGLNVYPDNVRELPIPDISLKQQKPFTDIVDDILKITKSEDYTNNSENQNKVKEYEKQIDQMVYKLYDFTPEEVDIIENSNK